MYNMTIFEKFLVRPYFGGCPGYGLPHMGISQGFPYEFFEPPCRNVFVGTELVQKERSLNSTQICTKISLSCLTINSLDLQLQRRVFLKNFAKFVRTSFLQNTTDATVSNTYQIQLKKVSAAAKIQKQLPQVFCKRRPTSLFKKGSSIAKFLRATIQKTICERLSLKISIKFFKGSFLF